MRNPLLYIIRIVGDVEPSIQGPYRSELARVRQARKWRTENYRDGLFRLDSYDNGRVGIDSFTGGELDPRFAAEVDRQLRALQRKNQKAKRT